jgi:hypothetical protein
MERLSRKDDQEIYQPKIRADQIRKLYQVKLETGTPLTVLVDRAIREFLARYETGEDEKNTRNHNV